MVENTNISLTVEAWAEIVIKEWIKKCEALKIGNTGLLINSFANTIYTAANGDPGRIIFAFEWYGKMVDWGVGKGVSLQNRDSFLSSGISKRQPKPWYSDVFYKQLAVMRHLLEEKHALRIENLIVNTIST